MSLLGEMPEAGVGDRRIVDGSEQLGGRDDAAVGEPDLLGGTSEQLDRRQPATARARLSGQAPDVADRSAGRRTVPEHGDRDLADVARRDRSPHVDDLDEQVLDGDVQPAELARRAISPTSDTA